MKNLQKPNINAGWVAISQDNSMILWSAAYNHFALYMSCAVRYDVKNKSYAKVNIYDVNGVDISYSHKQIKFFSDKLKSSVFYGFGDCAQFYISRDYGENFNELRTSNGFPTDYFFAGIDGMKKCEIRCEPDKSGVIWLALNDDGLWRIDVHEHECDFTKVSVDGDFVKTVGFGKGITDNIPAIYTSGILFGEYGFWRSLDYGESFARINNDKQMYGGIVSMDGDMECFGRMYLATNTYGALWGMQI